MSAREIGRRLGVARSTVQDNLKRAAAAGLAWPLADEVTDDASTRGQRWGGMALDASAGIIRRSERERLPQTILAATGRTRRRFRNCRSAGVSRLVSRRLVTTALRHRVFSKRCRPIAQNPQYLQKQTNNSESHKFRKLSNFCISRAGWRSDGERTPPNPDQTNVRPR